MNIWLKDNLFEIARMRGHLKTGQSGLEINQSSIEELTGVPQTTLSGIMSQGKTPRVDTIEKLAKGFGLDVWQLLAPPPIFRASLTAKFADLVNLVANQ